MEIVNLLGTHKEDALIVWNLIMAHKVAAAFALFMASGMGANALVRVLNLIPLGWWYSVVKTFFSGVSRIGNMRFGRPLWQPFEEWLEKFLGGTMDAAREGLDSDNGTVPH